MTSTTIEPLGAEQTGPRMRDEPTAASLAADFDAVFSEHYERLVRTLTVIAGDVHAAEDAVQGAFVKAHLRWRRISRYDDPAGWVRRVAINALRDDHRRRSRGRRVIDRLRSRAELSTEPDEIDEFDRLLAALPRQQRAATALHYVDGLSIAEIATALDVAPGTVKSHLHDARRRLRPVLEREADTPPSDPDHRGAPR
jgi:RNA polymerase sigma-70 factor (ECF subfamily)